MFNSESRSSQATANETTNQTTPPEFQRAVDSMHRAHIRSELSLGEIRSPQKLAPYTHAVGIELQHNTESSEIVPTDSSGDCFGRLILLHDPAAEDAWDGAFRLVAYIQADLEDEVANDPLLPDVCWQWLTEGLDRSEGYTHVGGTVTATTSVRFGEIGGPPRAYQLEMRASWTAAGSDLSSHVEAFAAVMANVAGLPPEGVTAIG